MDLVNVSPMKLSHFQLLEHRSDVYIKLHNLGWRCSLTQGYDCLIPSGLSEDINLLLKVI